MAATAAARQAAPAPARRPAPRRKPRQRPRPKARTAPARSFQPGAAVALLPQAAVRGAGAVRDISDSSLIMRLTRGRGWIAVLCALLGGIVALNVVSLSLTMGSGRTALAIDALKQENSALRAEIAERLSSSRVEQAALDLGLAVPDPKEITYLSARDADAEKLARLLDTGTLLDEPSLPSSYPTASTVYPPSSSTSTSGTSTTAPSPTPTPTVPSTTAPSSSGTSSSSGSTGGSSGATGGVGL